jgi:hypothetical protein
MLRGQHDIFGLCSAFWLMRIGLVVVQYWRVFTAVQGGS